MEIDGLNLNMVGGDDETIIMQVSEDGVVKPLVNGDKIEFTVWNEYGNVTLIEKAVTIFIDGRAYIVIDSVDTVNLDNKSYLYNIKRTDTSGKIKTIIDSAYFTVRGRKKP